MKVFLTVKLGDELEFPDRFGVPADRDQPSWRLDDPKCHDECSNVEREANPYERIHIVANVAKIEGDVQRSHDVTDHRDSPTHHLMLLWQTLGQKHEAASEAPDETHTEVETREIDYAYIVRKYGAHIQRQL